VHQVDPGQVRRVALHVCLIVSVAVAVLRTDAAGSVGDAEAFALVARARALHDIKALATTSFRLRAEVSLGRMASGPKNGDYLLVRHDAEHWFERIGFPGYQELRGNADGQAWRRRNTVDRPQRVHQTIWTLELLAHLELPGQATASAVSVRTVGGRAARCATFSPTRLLWQHDRAGRVAAPPVAPDPDRRVELCFDEQTGALLRADYGLPLLSYEYSGELRLGDVAVPRVARCLEEDDVIVEATVTEFAADPDTLPGNVPKGAESWPRCDRPSAPVLKTKGIIPEVPQARVRRQFGTVIAFAEVGRDGWIHDLVFIQGPHAVLNNEVAKGVGAWEYEPATCSGQPVPTNVLLAVTFPP
jgi:hypothetical protein